MEKNMNCVLSAVIHEEEGWFIAECPEVGTCSQGITIKEATFNLRDATELYLEEFPLQKIGKSYLTTFEVSTCVTQ
jgi:predicted RNase H-like HicB family nuclease